MSDNPRSSDIGEFRRPHYHPVPMSALAARRRRTAAIVAVGIAAEVAVLVPSGTVDALFFPGVPGVTAATIAAIVAILAGPAGGAVVAVVGWSMYFPLIADGRAGTLV